MKWKIYSIYCRPKKEKSKNRISNLTSMKSENENKYLLTVLCRFFSIVRKRYPQGSQTVKAINRVCFNPRYFLGRHKLNETVKSS